MCTITVTWKEHRGFRTGRECMDEVFFVKHVCEKYVVNDKDVF